MTNVDIIVYRIVLLLTASATSFGCASTKAYFIDRGRDAADIIIVGVGVGGGVKARIGPIHAGLAFIHDTVGLQGGGVFRYPVNSFESTDLETTWSLFQVFHLPEDERFKSFATEYEVNPLLSRLDRDGFGYEARCRDEKIPRLHPYYTGIEFAGGLLGTLRVGINAGEVVDFVLGWFGI